MKTKMKPLIVLIICLFASFANAQYDINSTKVLVSQNGYNYTEGHFQQELQFLEFVLGAPISPEELAVGKQESIAGFSVNPVNYLQDVANINNQMQQVYLLTDPSQIALVRSAFLSQFYVLASQMEEYPFIIQMIMKYAPALAIDPENMLTFTEQDFMGYLVMLQLNAQATGIVYDYSDEEILQLREALTQQFYSASLADRQGMCVMGVVAAYMLASYNQMTDVQKAAWQNEMMNQQAYQYQNYSDPNDPFVQGYNQAAANATYEPEWPAGVDTKEEKQAYLQQQRSNMNANQATFGIMNDMMMNNHATMLNTIENFGNTGNYWEVNYNNY
ncbi:MAG: hypothetical protein JXR53_07680 [Bacteroidales bacterium]|nr:hypothetical protein [Bacteroidales bacterium]